MNNLARSIRVFLQSEKFSSLGRTLGFWAFFWLILAVLQFMELPGLGSAAAPIGAGIAILAILALTVGLLRIDGGSFQDIGLSFSSKTLPQFVLGVGLGGALAAGMILALLILTPLEIGASPNSNFLSIFVVSFVILFALALMEELAFRSYPLFRLRQSLGIRPAVYVTSIAFAFYHGLAFENLLGPGVWGLFFGWMAISTNSIALPTGFHVGLNWLQALMGMKPRYSESIWELSVGIDSGSFDVDTLGLLMQVILLAVGILIVEMLVKKHRKIT